MPPSDSSFAEPATKRAICFIVGQNLYHYSRAAFNCTHPNYDVMALDTNVDPTVIREAVRSAADSNDVVFVVRLTQQWSSWNFGCADWLNAPGRGW